MESGISQQPLVGSYSNLKLKPIGSNQSEHEKKTEDGDGRRPQNMKSRIYKQPLVGS
jgi:hypothetical protein